MAHSPIKENILIGSLFMLIGQFFSASVLTAVKIISIDISVGTIVFINYLTCLCFVILVMTYKKNISIRTKHIKLQILRAFLGTVYFVALFWAVTYTPAVDAMLLRSTAPIWAPIITFLWMRDTISYKILFGIMMGFVGIIFVLHPTWQTINPGYFLALLSAVSFAISGIITRKLNRLQEPLLRTLFYSFLLPAILLAPYACLHWPTLVNSKDITLVALIGLGTYLLLFFYISSLRYAPITLLLPLSYIGVVIAGGYDWLIWDHVPTIPSMIGMVIVFFSCSFVVWVRHQESSMYSLQAKKAKAEASSVH